jgi:hypothetical protein
MASESKTISSGSQNSVSRSQNTVADDEELQGEVPEDRVHVLDATQTIFEVNFKVKQYQNRQKLNRNTEQKFYF